MNKKFILLFFLSLPFGRLFAETVMFDANGVLFSKKSINALKCFSFKETLDVIFNAHRVERNMYDHLACIPSSKQAKDIQKNNPCCDDKGKKLPPVMVDWLLGNIDAKTIYKNVANMGVCSGYDKELALTAIKTFFPENLSRIIVPNKKMFQLAKECKENGNKVIILSNFDPLTFKELMKKNPELFDFFDDIIVSGDIQLIKPCKDIYEHAFKKTDSVAEDVIFIDDQKENVEAIDALGAVGIQHKSYALTKKQLKAIGII